MSSSSAVMAHGPRGIAKCRLCLKRQGNSPVRLIFELQGSSGMPPANFPRASKLLYRVLVVCVRGSLKIVEGPVGPLQIVLPCGTNLAARSRNSVGTEPSLLAE